MIKYCPKCGVENQDNGVFCSKCGTNMNIAPSQTKEHSGAVPEDIKGWNMGAFMQPVVWGIANEVYESLWFLTVIIPFIGWLAAFAIMIWMGINGNELAYKKKKWDTTDDFKKCQNTWNRAGWLTFILSLLSGFVYFIVFVVMGLAETGFNF